MISQHIGLQADRFLFFRSSTRLRNEVHLIQVQEE